MSSGGLAGIYLKNSQGSVGTSQGSVGMAFNNVEMTATAAAAGADVAVPVVLEEDRASVHSNLIDHTEKHFEGAEVLANARLRLATYTATVHPRHRHWPLGRSDGALCAHGRAVQLGRVACRRDGGSG